ncbi:cyclic nucleotide-binding domain-containing protein [Deferribacter autotrophicus]|uniref:Cyclic nucleotide-binding domain-containing protein n=1 Tax=Deferribacter autotrophicus TaxID=500465 RepID=A0A5A8F6G7_9BACT|nr:cyclic nucleotide-binding domain-containing protein [Deferribacter autotrophicus]KAA0259190.1 cyclic nucleotide-binding domain-containing protein [Deferribacter autotrophicus]
MNSNNLIKKFELNDKILELIKKYGEVITIESGNFLFNQGDIADSAYLLLSGELEVLIKDKKGSLKTINKLEPKIFFGEMGLFHFGKRTTAIRAVSTSNLIKINFDTFFKIAYFKHKLVTIIYLLKLNKELNKKVYKLNLDNICSQIKLPKNEFLKVLFYFERKKVVFLLDLISENIIKFRINKHIIDNYLYNTAFEFTD